MEDKQKLEKENLLAHEGSQTLYAKVCVRSKEMWLIVKEQGLRQDSEAATNINDAIDTLKAISL